MLRSLIVFLSTIAATIAQAGPAPRYAAGLADLHVEAEDGRRPLDGYLWYPAAEGAWPMRFRDNAVWRGFDAFPNAPLADGRFPLVMLSHGLYGNAANQAWLATTLAEAGFLVVAPNHPGTSTLDRDPEARSALWERPRDISRAISMMLEHPLFGQAIAADSITAIGHSLGGYDVMALAGARYDAARHRAYCNEHPERPDCVFVREAGIGADRATLEKLQASLADRRITAVVSFDLGLTQAFEPQSLSEMTIPALVIGAGRGDTLNVEDESRALAAALPTALVRYFEPAGTAHYDFLAVCKEGAVAVLKEESPGEEFVCEAGGAPREAQHAIITEAVMSFLRDVGSNPD